MGTNVRLREFSAGLLARSQFASGGSYDRSNKSRFLVIFLGPRTNAELVHKFHVALHASHVALPMVTSKLRPNIALPMLEFHYNAALPMSYKNYF
jgi:hypothetical protein